MPDRPNTPTTPYAPAADAPPSAERADAPHPACGMPHVGIGVIITRRFPDGLRVLVGLRTGSHQAELWAFPGGHLDPTESWEACGTREADEETGCRIGPPVVVAVVNDVMPEDRKHYVTILVEAPWVAGEAERREPGKCREWRWVPWDTLPTPHRLPLDLLRRAGYRPGAPRPPVAPSALVLPAAGAPFPR